jgi:hypothetical protein
MSVSCGAASVAVTSWTGIISAMTARRVAVIPGAALGAVLLGGAAQTYVWRWGAEGLTAVTNSQFGWALLCFLVAWAWAQGRVSSGMIAGLLTGLGLIVSYYCVQWLADGRHAAVSQFTGTYGIAWTVAAMGGGALVGGLGALAGASAERQPTRKALGLATAALVVGLGPLVWFWADGDVLHDDGIWIAITCYGATGLLLGVFALWKCGIAPFLRGLCLAVLASSAALASLLVLQATLLYTTF